MKEVVSRIDGVFGWEVGRDDAIKLFGLVARRSTDLRYIRPQRVTWLMGLDISIKVAGGVFTPYS